MISKAFPTAFDEHSLSSSLAREISIGSPKIKIRHTSEMSSPTVKLNNGYEMPLVGFGLWKVNNDTCADQVYNAIKAGYRLLDGACGMLFLLCSAICG